ncbi:putative methyltransferase-domain-containing protein [Lipomyces arxii]|uniref:putative methyltransferase-domain-containing protein n=1 Tax=Lipomyces arxii TaxID=56418 RepID=UPI0034CD7DD2
MPVLDGLGGFGSGSESDETGGLFKLDVPVPVESITFAGLEYVPTHAGVLEADFNGTSVKLQHDAGATGCGGKLWPAGELLSRYLVSAKDDESYVGHQVWKRAKDNVVRVLELGSGTGLVGLVLGNAMKNAGHEENIKITITDQINMMGLMTSNVRLNGLEDIVTPTELDWGSDSSGMKVPDVILAADCVYFEPAFPLLEKTLLDLTGPNTLVLMSYKKRRRADHKFFHSIRKSFIIEEVKNYKEYPEFSRETVFLYRLIPKRK